MTRGENINRQAMGDRLRSAREVRGLTQRQLAEKLGVAVNTVWRWENGERGFVDFYEDVAKILKVDAYWLLSGKKAKGAA